MDVNKKLRIALSTLIIILIIINMNIFIIAWLKSSHNTDLQEQIYFGLRNANSKKSIMIIATKPYSKLKLFSIWSQLECFAEKVDKIIISNAKNEFEDELSAFLEEVKRDMPQIGSKIEVQNHLNDRYDAGLWCDALTIEGNATHKRSSVIRPLLLSEYDQFFLINDSIIAVEPFNEVLDALERKNADLVSLNYWMYKNYEKEGVVNGTYWVESPVRAFSKKGMQVYSNHVCNLDTIRWRADCPHLKNLRNHRNKRCIVEKTEIDVAKYFPQDKVFGLYSGDDGTDQHWANNFTYWNKLRDEQSFPAMKNSNTKMLARIRIERPQDFTRCTTKYKDKSSERK